VVVSISGVAALFTLLSGSLDAENQYYLHALISDQPGTADLVDPNLSNPWGIQSEYAGPVWIGNNSTGVVTLYLAIPPAIGTGTSNYTIPSSTGSGAAITSIVPFGVADPDLTPLSGGSAHVNLSPLFCTQDGAIVGVFPGPEIALPDTIIVPPPLIIRTLVDNLASGAAYTGCTGGANASGQPGVVFLYAANFNRGTIDVFDGGLQPVANSAAFVDPAVPAGFAPFKF
jgi:uncharacterized protein (TIGR03118 family)